MVVLFAAACSIADSQVEIKAIDPMYPHLASEFEHALAEHRQRPLACLVEPIRPRLGYSFRFYAGFYATYPARQFEMGTRNRATAVVRVSSERTGETHYFLQPLTIPPIPQFPGKTELEAGGGFYLGEGTYQVDWLMADQNDRVCTRSWKVRTPRTKLAPLIPAGSVQPLGLESWKGFGEKKAGAASGNSRVTVFLSAMPVYRRHTLSKLPPYDLAILLGSLTTVLDSSRYRHARVVAFDLLSKRILFEDNEFDPAGYALLRNKLENTNYGTIDYQTLARGMTDRKLFEQMLKEEASHPDRSDAVIFLGAEGYPSDKLPPVFAEYRQGLAARLYYIFFGRFPQPVEDIMYQFVRAGKGKIVNLWGPPDLVNAIRAIDAGN